MAGSNLRPSESDDPVGETLADTSPSPPIRRADLIGEELTLRPLVADRDVDALHSVSHGSEARERVWTYMAYGPFESRTAMHEFLFGCERSDDPRFYTAIRNETGEAVGFASLLAFDAASRRVEVGHIWIGADFHRGRTATELVWLLLRESFDVLRCRRVEWKCDSLNERSRRAALRLGFRFEGIFRQHGIVKGRNRDTAWYSMLDSEWPRAKEALVRWLDWREGAPPSLASLREDPPKDPAPAR